MISKLISYGETREIAIIKMKRALRDYTVHGVKTNINFLLSLLESDAFMTGNYNTQYVERYFLSELKNKTAVINEDLELAIALAVINFKEKDSFSESDNIKLKKPAEMSKWLLKRLGTYR